MKVVKGGTVSGLLRDVPIPPMFRARQTFPRERIEPGQIPEAVWAEMSKPEFDGKIQPGMKIAITAGSRGIRNVDVITKAIVDYVKEKKAKPFIVPAMGSHGGATAGGPVELL